MLGMSPRTTEQVKPRIEGGVPKGGEFTFKAMRDAEDMGFDRFLGESIGTDVLTKRKARDSISAADALIVAQYHARLVTHGGNYQDVEDVAQQAIVYALEMGKRPEVTPGILATMAKTARAHQAYALAGLRHEDVKGRDQVNAAVSAIEEFERREVSEREREAIADLTRDTWEQPRHKPRIGFEKHFRNVALEENFDAVEAVPAEPSISADDQRTPGHQLADQVEAGTLSRAEAYLKVWDAFADEFDLPGARANSLDEKTAATFEALVVDPVGTAKAVAAGVAHPSVRTAFLAPLRRAGTSSDQRPGRSDRLPTRPRSAPVDSGSSRRTRACAEAAAHSEGPVTGHRPRTVRGRIRVRSWTGHAQD